MSMDYECSYQHIYILYMFQPENLQQQTVPRRWQLLAGAIQDALPN